MLKNSVWRLEISYSCTGTGMVDGEVRRTAKFSTGVYTHLYRLTPKPVLFISFSSRAFTRFVTPRPAPPSE
jgi:hypothetical protein